MRLLTRPWLVLAIAVAVVALPTVASGALSAQAVPSANSVTYPDSVGEEPAAPDVTSIVVSNDDAGTITMRINTPNRPQYASDIAVFIDIDSDANQATGDTTSFGADHFLALFQGEPILFRWDGTDYTLSATQSSLAYTWSGGPTIRINASDLNNTRRFSFAVQTVSGIVFDQNTGATDCTACKRDFAPAIGLHTFPLSIEKPTLVVKRVTTTGKPKAGKPFTVRMVAARSDTGANIQNGRVTCIGRAGNARLRAKVQRVIAGAATCTWTMPPGSKGKSFRGSVAVTFEGLRAAESFSSRIG